MILASDIRINLVYSFIIVLVFLSPSTAQNKINTPPLIQNSVLKGSVSTSDFPIEFYGTWKVINTLESTNNPGKFLAKSSDYWVFERHGNTISMSNPISGAQASISVKDVQGKTAVFERIKKDYDYSETETAEITVDEDSFQGYDTIIMNTYYIRGKRVNIQDVVKYKVRGYRLN